MNSGKRERVIVYKLLFTLIVVFFYLLGRSVPLYGIDVAAYTTKNIDAQNLLTQTISGDINQYSLFALGISPYMMSSIFVQVCMAFRSGDSKSRTSPKKTNILMLTVTTIVAFVQASMHVSELQFKDLNQNILVVESIAIFEMVAGVMLILWLSERNKKYGVGGQTALIFVNIIDGLILTLKDHSFEELKVPVLVAILAMFVMLIMENTEKRIPVQRISIHNIYADRNYLAIKLNPIGVMPVMFSTAFFMLPQLVLTVLKRNMPENKTILWCESNMSLNRPLGIIVYLLILYLLTIGFSRVFVNPRDITEQFLKSGDSILNLHAGKDTKRYLSREILRLSLLSATVMSACLGIPMFLQFSGNIDSSLVMLPSSAMMLTGIWCNLYREAQALYDYDAYEAFL